MRLGFLDYFVSHPNTVVHCTSLISGKSLTVVTAKYFKVVKYFMTGVSYSKCLRMFNQDDLFRNLCLR